MTPPSKAFAAAAAYRMARILPRVLLLAAGAALLFWSQPAAAFFQSPEAGLTAEQDHRRLLGLLHIEKLRSGADGYDRTGPNAANYDEARAGAPPLPDPLRLDDGRRVTTARAWWRERRPQIVEAFDREVYGRAPKVSPRVDWQVVETTSETLGGIGAVTKRLRGRVEGRGDPVEIEATLSLPRQAHGRVPVIVEMIFVPPPGVNRPPREGPDGRIESLKRGWGYASYVPVSVQPDNGAGLSRGVIGLSGKPRSPEDWGALKAWAWGASRLLDHLAADPAVDGRRVAIAGLSRYGKATLVAMAYDPRFAVAFVGSSGAGGAKLLRRDFGERVENLASSGAYHWMAGNFLKYAGPKTAADLPIDAHELIALCAPRPVFVSVGNPDAESWTDPRGMFLATVAAGPVYRLLGAKPLASDQYPQIGVGLTDGDLAFRQHSGGHTLGPNWPAFLDFAARYFKPGPGAAP